MNKIITGLCGSGKTYQVANFDIPNSQELLHIYFAPSIKVSTQFYDMIPKNAGIEIITINSVETSSVLCSVIETVKKNEENNHKTLIIATHSVYVRLLLDSISNWNVYIDEALPDFIISPIRFGQTGSFSTYFEGEPSLNTPITLRSDLEISSDKHGNLSTELRQLISQLGSGRFNAILTKLPNDKNCAEVALIPSEDFWVGKSVTYIGADLEKTRLGKLLKNAKVIVKESNNKNHHSKNIKIRYYLEGSNAKYARKESVEVIKEITKHNNAFHKNEHSIAWANKYEDYGFVSADHNLAGSNEFAELTHATFFTSMNMPKHVVDLLKKFGVDSEYLYETITLNTAYQLFMRINLRQNVETPGTTLTVLDSKLAYALKETYFPNATIERVGEFEWVKKIAKDSFKKKVGNTVYLKALNIRKQNPKLKDMSVEEVYLKLKTTGKWDNYTHTGKRK